MATSGIEPKTRGRPPAGHWSGMDRRRSPRYPAGTGATAILRTRPVQMGNLMEKSQAEIALALFQARPEIYGPIVDIGPGGLAFRYLPPEQEWCAPQLRGSTSPLVLDLLFSEKRIFLEHLPYRLVADRPVPGDLPARCLPRRQIHLRFLPFDPARRTGLAAYIRQAGTRRWAQRLYTV